MNNQKAPRRRLGLAMASTGVLLAGLAPAMSTTAHAEGYTSGKVRGFNDNTFEMYVKKGETAKLRVEYAKKTLTQAKHTVTIKAPGGASKTCTLTATYETGKDCSVSLKATQDGVMVATIDSSAAPSLIDQPSVGHDADSTQYFWDATVTSAAGKALPGRVWSPGPYLAAQDHVNYNKADVVAGAANVNVFFLDDRGWLYQAAYKQYNGVFSWIMANNLGITNAATGEIMYRSASADRTDIKILGKNNRTAKIFFNYPAADLPAAAVWPDGKSKTVSRALAPIEPKVTNAKFTSDNVKGSMAGKFTFSVADYEGNLKAVVDTNRDGKFDAQDRTIVLNNLGAGTHTATFDGKDSTGKVVPTDSSLNAKVFVESFGEIHFLNRDVELRGGGISVKRHNGPGTGRSTLYWNDTDLTNVKESDTPKRDGRAGVDSTNGVHGWAAGGTGGMVGHGDRRIINDWTNIKKEIAAPFSVTPPSVPQPALKVDKVQSGEILFVELEDASDEETSEEPAAAPKQVARVPYTIQVKAINGDNSDVVVADLPLEGLDPSTVEFVSATKGTWDKAAGLYGGLKIDQLKAGEVVTLKITVDMPVEAEVGDKRTNAVIATSKEAPKPIPTTPPAPDFVCQINGNVDLDTDQCDVVTDASPDLKVWKRAQEPDKAVGPGDEIRFDIDFGNMGGTDATDVVLTDFAPEGVDLDTAKLVDPTMGTVEGLTLNIGDLKAGETGKVTFVGTVAADVKGSIENRVTITTPGDPVDPDRPDVCVENDDLASDDDNCDIAEVPVVGGADVKIQKIAESSERLNATDVKVTYTLNVLNDSERAARNVVVTDTYPEGTDVETVTVVTDPTMGEFDPATGVWTVTDRLAAQGEASVKISMIVRDVASNEDIVNTAIVDSPDDPHVPGEPCIANAGDITTDDDNCDFVTTPAPGAPQLKINKRDSEKDGGKPAITVKDGIATITYTVEVGNTGTGDDTDVVAVDTLPKQAINGSLKVLTEGTDLKVENDKWTWAIGDLPAGEVVTTKFQVDYNVKDILGTDVVNKANVSSPMNPKDPKGGDVCQVNETLAADEDQCDVVVTSIPGPPAPETPADPKDPGSPLPNTGGPAGWILGGGLAAMIAGAGALLFNRRKAVVDQVESTNLA